MKEMKIKQIRQAEWLQQYTLTQEQTKQLIMNKVRRAEEMHTALKKQEMLIKERR